MSTWSISKLKFNAKANLKKYYWWAFLVCLIISFVSGGAGGLSGNFSNINSNIQDTVSTDDNDTSAQSSPYGLGYSEGYDFGYKSFQQGLEINVDGYKKYIEKSNIDADSEYGKGEIDGYKAGYKDAFENKTYDSKPKGEPGSDGSSSRDFREFKKAIEDGGIEGLYNKANEALEGYLPAVISITAAILVFSMAVGICFKFFVVNPLIVGKVRFFQDARAGTVQFGRIGYAFGKGHHYTKTVGAMALANVYVMLLSFIANFLAIFFTIFFLSAFSVSRIFANETSFIYAIIIAACIYLGLAALFSIPAYILKLSYTLVPYIKAQNSEMKAGETLKLSRKIMKGEKLHFFGLQLSFIGWYILGMMLCGVGVMFVNPYAESTFNEFYALMREKALYYNFTDMSGLPGFPQPAPQTGFNQFTGYNGEYNQYNNPSNFNYQNNQYTNPSYNNPVNNNQNNNPQNFSQSNQNNQNGGQQIHNEFNDDQKN